MAKQRAKASPAGVVMGKALAVMNTMASSDLLDKLNLRKPMEKALYKGTKTGFTSLGAASRQFAKVTSSGKPARPASASGKGVFDLTPTEDQQMIQEITREFAAEQLRPVAAEADHDCTPPAALLKRVSSELEINVVGIPEQLGGMGNGANHRRPRRRGASHGDMGLALSSSFTDLSFTAITLWVTIHSSRRTCRLSGDEPQQPRWRHRDVRSLTHSS